MSRKRNFEDELMIATTAILVSVAAVVPETSSHENEKFICPNSLSSGNARAFPTVRRR
jgi:hypothetical protein